MSATQTVGAERMSRLAETFPSLVGQPGVRPWSPNGLDAATQFMSTGQRCAALFALSVWSSTREWLYGQFNVVVAFQWWDPAHREAFMAWAREPWQP